MVDTLLKHVRTAVERAPWRELGLEPGAYALLTLHRPSNVDDDGALAAVMQAITSVSSRIPILFPVHPRTRRRLEGGGIPIGNGIRLCEPLPYLAFLGLMAKSRFVLTDSGGIQEETTALGVPCLTLRRNTERPVTVTHGTNRLATTPEEIQAGADEILAGRWRTGERVPLWDGRASERIVDVLVRSRP